MKTLITALALMTAGPAVAQDCSFAIGDRVHPTMAPDRIGVVITAECPEGEDEAITVRFTDRTETFELSAEEGIQKDVYGLEWVAAAK